MQSRLFIIFSTILVLGGPAAPEAESQVRNSVYSMFGVGQILDNSFGINQSMGGTGIAFGSGRSINFSNPASYIGLAPRSLNVELGVYGLYSATEQGNLRERNADFNFSYVSGGFYGSSRWSAAFGILPFSAVDYTINSVSVFGGEPVTFHGTGGLWRLVFGNSVNIFKEVTFGVNASYIVGPITHSESIIGTDDQVLYEMRNFYSVNGGYMEYGLRYTFGGSDWRYGIGLLYGPHTVLNADYTLDFIQNNEITPIEEGEPRDIAIPRKIGVGISVQKGAVARAGLDYEWKNWANVSFPFSEFTVRDGNRLSIGGEYLPRPDGGWLTGLRYRIGAYYEQSYLELNNSRINSKGVTAGIGIPSGVNFGVEYGSQGSVRSGLMKTNYVILHVTMSLHELFWSQGIPE